MHTLRVLHVLNELNPSGAEVMLRVAAPHWREHGVRSAILTKGIDEGTYAPRLREAGYTLYHLPFDRPLSFALQWIQFLRRNAFDIVHVHTEHANFWIALLARLAGVPGVVRTVHNVFAFEGQLRRVRMLQRGILRVLGVRHVSVGPSVFRSERERFDNPTTLVHNWYDTKRFVPPTREERRRAREMWSVDASTFVITTVGNCSHVKNHSALLEALTLLPSRRSVTYLHVGLADDEKREVEQARELGIRDQVQFLGYVDDVCSVLNASDVFVMPSLFEGYPISAIEAMGAGVPVIFTDVPGLRDLAKLSDQILWADPKPASLSRRLNELLDMSLSDRRGVGRLLHKQVKSTLNPMKGVRLYTGLYRGAFASASHWRRQFRSASGSGSFRHPV